MANKLRVLVTGASGFVGRHAVKALRQAGHTVIAAGRCASDCEAQEFVKVDLLAPGAGEEVAGKASADALLHLAWVTEHGSYWNDLANLQWLASSVELVTALVRRGTRRVCAAGTCFEYAWPDGDCDETETPISSHTIYDASKSACFRVLTDLARDKRFSLAWGRLFYLYGPGEQPQRLVASVCRSLAAGDTARCTSGSGVRDFMDVRDAGAALAALTVSDYQGPINVASGHGAKIREVAETIGRIAGCPERVAIGALPDRENDPPRITANTDRLTREVGFTARWTLEEGLRHAYESWRSAN